MPLLPLAATVADENRALARALSAHDNAVRQTGARDAVDALDDFLSAWPTSGWRPALLVNLGVIYRQSGHFSKALASWQTAWQLSKSASGEAGAAVGDAAVGHLSQSRMRVVARVLTSTMSMTTR